MFSMCISKHVEMHSFTCVIPHRPSNTMKLSKLCQPLWPESFLKRWETSHRPPLRTGAGVMPTIWGWPGGTPQTTAAAPSEAKLSHLIFLASAAHSCLQSSHWGRRGVSHLLLEKVASAVPLLLWPHPHSTATFKCYCYSCSYLQPWVLAEFVTTAVPPRL
jgi:hypothetical protein